MKKFLSLVLALVMTMSLVTISAGAADFTDDESITYAEAIDVMSAVKVVDGYPDGSFKPSNQLNRGQAAQILCNMLLGPTTASALKADSAPFKDVAADNTFAGYIAYCVQAGIIDGYTDGTFRPTAPLTGYAFMKLLLGALGYDKDVEGYNVPNWSINVAKQALAIGLDDGLVGDFDGTKIVTREEACLYAFNALQADLVEYGSKTTVNVGGAEVVIAGTAAKAVTWNNSATKKTNIKDDNYVQFAEQYFNKLVKTDTSDAFARPATKWTYKGDKIGTYADKADASYTKNVELGDIYADLGMTQEDANAEVYVNGKQETDVAVSKNNTTKIASSSANKDLVGDGSIVEVFYNEDGNDVTICVIDVFVGEVTSVDKKANDPFVVIHPYTTTATTNATISNFKFETEESFSEDDVVLFNYSEKDEEIKNVKVAESVEGALSKITYTKSVDLAGTTYKYNKNMAFEALESDLTTKTDYVAYLDANGLAIYIEEKEFNADEYAFVLDAENASDVGFTYDRAKLVLSDGTLKTVYTDDEYANLKGQIVTYRQDSNNEYVLRKAPNSTFNGSGEAKDAISSDAEVSEYGPTKGGVNATGGFVMKNGHAAIRPGNKDASGNYVTVYANSETVFVVAEKDGTGTNYTAYTGIKNAPTIVANDSVDANGDPDGTDVDVEMFYYVRGNNLLAFAFIDATNATVTDGSNSVVFLAAKESVSKKILDSDGKEYYTYNAVVGGEITTVKLLASQVGGYMVGKEGDDSKNYVFQNPSYNNKNMIKDSTQISDDYVAGNRYTLKENYTAGIWKLSGKYTIGLNSTTTASASVRYTVATDAKIYRIDTDGVISQITIDDIYSDTNDRITALMDNQDGDLAYLFIQEVDDNKKENAPVVADLSSFTAVENGAGSAIDMTVTLTGKASAATNVTLTVYAMNGGTWVEMTSVTATVAKDATTSGTVTLSGLAAGQYKVTCGDLAPKFVVV